jgi:alkanesulfonate monooxygenase SsuD/methylene tetrahydromethanopterin reductase-like flavin-dependent oxidoreductase (luciferase family)
MKFGLNFTPIYPWEMGDLAVTAESLGFESLWIGEHVLVPFEEYLREIGQTSAPTRGSSSRGSRCRISPR